MLFHPSLRPKAKAWYGKPTIDKIEKVELKLDGHRTTIVKENGKITSYSKDPCINTWHDLEKCRFAYEIAAKLPDNSVLDGELYIPGKEASDVVSYIKARSDKLEFQPFAMPIQRGKDIRFISCAEALQRMFDEGFVCTSSYPKENATKERALELRKRGIEGMMLKELHYAGWWKLKAQFTLDVVVMDTKPGKGKHNNRIGALVCGLFKGKKLVEVASVGKGNDDLWRDYYPREMIGRVCEITHEGVQAKGKLRFSNFLRWRDDKPAHQCVFSDLKDGG